MNMKIMEDTLFVHLCSEDEIRSLKRQMFGVLNEYDIHNIVLNIIGSDLYNTKELDQFLHSFRFTHHANFIIK